MVLGTILIYWAQKTSSCLKEKIKDNNTHHTFARGPYKFSRNPTHMGLTFLTLGFGMLIGSFFVMMFTIVAFVLTKFIFLPKQEKILEEKYGQSYCEYKKKVKSWL